MSEEAKRPTKHLTIEELAERWGMAPLTLGNWRVQGKGPRYLKVGRRVLYALADVESWERSNTRKSTSG